MEFLDNTGHIFSLKSYNEKPIGYEYDETPYIFWIDSTTSKLSVNNYYSRPIYCLYLMNNNYNIDDLDTSDNPNKEDAIEISISIEKSNVFSLISAKKLNQYIFSDNYTNLNDYIDLDAKDNDTYIKQSLSNDDLCVIKTTESKQTNNGTAELNYLLIPIYPIACSPEEGTWITNIIIHIYDRNNNTHDWCPISVGGEFINEYEELIINGKNVGVSLPKDILKAVYSESLYNDEFNESLYNEKLKEYLINLSVIKNERGNFKSVINSLKWFGYGDKLTISKLLKTDNDLKSQYLLDYFSISYDVIDAFKKFVSDSLISIKLMIDKELDEQYPFDTSKDFFGENKPKIQSLLDTYEKIKIGNHDMPIENDDEKYWYWKPYFDFSFNELGVKLACLKDFYKKYFLPIHLYIHSIGLGSKVFANDIKYTITTGVSMSNPSIVLNDKEYEVEFNKYNDYYYTKQIHYIDENFNEFNIADVDNDVRDLYEINDTCVNIPIKFISNDYNKGYFNCVLILLNSNISDKPLFESKFAFCQTDDFKYKNFIIYPKKFNINKNLTSNYFQYWINDNFIIKLLVNNKWYEYTFNLKIHNPTIDFGTLRYRYYFNDQNYLLSKIKDNGIHSIVFTKSNLFSLNYEIDNIYDLNKLSSTNDLSYINDSLYNILGLYDNELNDVKYKTFIKTLDLSNKETLYQYLTSNYNILSPFKQLYRIDNDNHRISFNSYMHTNKLVDVNNIDFDIDFYKILKYHLDRNLLYIDGTLLCNEFYQYIIYNGVEVLIHKDLIGSDIEIPYEYLNNDKIVVCAWKDNLYILSETGEHTDSYFINTVSDNANNDVYVSENDESQYALLFDSLNLVYNKSIHAYNTIDKLTNSIIDTYYIYDKLYKNTDYIYNNYQYEVNLPNLDKYKNSLHLFDIYTRERFETNILMFHNNINIYINNLNFTNKLYKYDDIETYKIYITGKSTNENIDSHDINVYGLHLIEPYISEGKILNIPKEISLGKYEYGFYVKRDYSKYFKTNSSDSIDNIYDLDNLFEFDTEEFTYYIEPINIAVGKLYFKTLEDFYNNNYYNKSAIYGFEDIEIFKDNNDNTYYFYDTKVKDLNDLSKYYKNKLKFSFTFYDETDTPVRLNMNELNSSDYSYISITLYYQPVHIVRNRFYLIIDYIQECFENGLNYIFDFNNEDTLTITDIDNNQIQTVSLIKLNHKYIYEDQLNHYYLSNQNPSYYWYNVDNDKITTLSSYLNELERFTYNNETESLTDIINKLDIYKSKHISKDPNDSNEARYKYYNYLSKDITGKIGIFKLYIDQSYDDNVKSNIMIEIFDENDNRIIYNHNEEFELTGKEKSAIIYIQLYIEDPEQMVNIWILPKLYKIEYKNVQLEYVPEEYGSEEITVNYLNKEYKYGNNLGENIYKLYSDFFNLKYNIYDTYIQDNLVKCEWLYSIYEPNDNIKLNMYLDYDFYLMHDDKYWYGLYISSETCNKVDKQLNLIIPDKYKEMTFIGSDNTEYVLKHKNSSKEYLINRYEFISSMGYNHFNSDDIICCYVHNNDRLPFNPYISSKWLITPLSLGMTQNSNFNSNAEMTILSIPKNDNTYQKGYYKVNVKYSLDRDIQHQFKNTSTFLIN